LAVCLIRTHNCCRVLLGDYGIWWSISLLLLRRMEFEDHCVVWSSKRTMEHLLWCVGVLIEAFGLFWCLKACYIPIVEFLMSKSVWVCICTLKFCFLEKVWIFVLVAVTFDLLLSWDVAFWSRYRPRYFTSFSTGMCILVIETGRQFAHFVVNLICEDFVWFILIFHLSNQSCRRSKWCWSRCDASAGSLSVARRAVSSAKVAIVVLLVD
jgi:hypothetical protein